MLGIILLIRNHVFAFPSLLSQTTFVLYSNFRVLYKEKNNFRPYFE